MSAQTWHSRVLKSQTRTGPWQRKQEEEPGGVDTRRAEAGEGQEAAKARGWTPTDEGASNAAGSSEHGAGGGIWSAPMTQHMRKQQPRDTEIQSNPGVHLQVHR